MRRIRSPTGDEDDDGGSNEVGQPFSRSKPSSSSRSECSSSSLDLSPSSHPPPPPSLDLRDVAVLKVPASYGFYFFLSSGEFIQRLFFVQFFLLFLLCCNRFVVMLRR